MPPKEFTLWFTGLPSETKTAIANLTTQELKRRGCEIETLDTKTYARRISDSSMHGEAIVFAVKSKTTETPEDLQATVEVKIGIPNYEKKNDESGNVVNDEHLTLTKIVVQPDAEPEHCIAGILSKLEGLDLIARVPSESSSYDEDDEAVIRRRLEGLGYL
jgi:Adenylylsulphate kinase